MDWNKTKTIFILTFLVLNAFLGYQLLEKKKNAELDQVIESTIEEQLAGEDITYQQPIPKASVTRYVSGKSKVFNQEDFSEMTEQNIIIRDKTMVVSTFAEPIPISEESWKEDLQKVLQEKVLLADQYTLWSRDEEQRVAIFFQDFKDKPIYFNENGLVLMLLNEEGAVAGYLQTYLQELEEIDLEKGNLEILPAIKAIENLYKKDMIASGSSVTNISMGYFTVVPLSGGVQVYAPTWHIEVDDDKSYFINAIEGHINEVNVNMLLQQVYQ